MSPGNQPRRLPSEEDFLKGVRQAVVRTARRLRWRDGWARVAWFAPRLALAWLPAMAAARLLWPWLSVGMGVAYALSLLLVFAVAFGRGAREALAARALDDSHGLFDGVTTSLELAERRARGERLDDFFAVALQRFQRTAPYLEPRRAVPRLAPAGGLLAATCTLAVLGLMAWRTGEPPLTERPPAIGASPRPGLGAIERAELDRALRELKDGLKSPAGRALAEQAERELAELGQSADGAEVFRRLDELGAELEARSWADRQLGEGLHRRGDRLSGARALAEASQAMRRESAAEAARALRQLADRLRDPKERLSARELDELRKSVEEAREARRREQTEKGEAAQHAERKREQLRDRERRLREKKAKRGGLNGEEQAELERTERELSRLDRHTREVEQTLSELDRKLEEAARALAEEQRKAGGFQEAARRLEEAAGELSKAAEKSLTDDEKREMLEKLERMREQLRSRREDGSAGEAQRNFERRARGEDPGQGRGSAQGEKQGSGRPSGRGPGGQPVPVPVPGSGTSRGSDAPGQGEGQGEGRDSQGQGPEAGTGHDDDLAGAASNRGARAGKDVSAVGQDTGQGQSQSETIRSAARGGFTRPGYRSLFQDYRTVAEEVMRGESIPPGYRTQVARYFDLIRPRDGASTTSRAKEKP